MAPALQRRGFALYALQHNRYSRELRREKWRPEIVVIGTRLSACEKKGRRVNILKPELEKQVDRLSEPFFAFIPLRAASGVLVALAARVPKSVIAILNAGVVVDGTALNGLLVDPVALGIVAGLVLGKLPVVLAGVWLGARRGIAKRPDDLGDRRVRGIGLLAGVGFTMSAFVAHLALEPGRGTLESAKPGIVTASVGAAVAGFIVMRLWAI